MNISKEREILFLKCFMRYFFLMNVIKILSVIFRPMKSTVSIDEMQSDGVDFLYHICALSERTWPIHLLLCSVY